MKFSISWLKEYTPITMAAEEIAEGLTMAGLEVDSVADRYAYLDTVVSGRIVSVEPHPNADKLKLCKVDIGTEQLDVVCGAPNAEAGMCVACALPGTEMPDGRVLEKSVIRKQASFGMLCSELELGIGADASGILSLAADIDPGQKLSKALNLDDTVFEVDLTPNRPDCLGIIGIAREVAAFQGSPLSFPAMDAFPDGSRITDETSVEIKDPDLCPRYAAALLKGIQIGPSPFWLQERLLSVGLRPINNIVDVTNFVMMETGQPLHAFDLDTLSGRRIVVRAAQKGETFTTLDSKQRELLPGMLLICDAEKPVALAGVMGGMNSEISDNTVNVLIESAYFHPTSIRKTSKTLGLNTDASHRFERGVDPLGTVAALKRAALLMREVAGGDIAAGVVDECPGSFEPTVISLSVSNTNRLLGTDLTQDTITRYLESIEFGVQALREDILDVIVPSFRVDVSRQEDLVEEVARLSGYNNIPTTFPAIPADSKPPKRQLGIRERIKDLMVGFGFTEAVNYSFISRSAGDQLRLPETDKRRNVVQILNPLSEEQAVMRTSLIPGMLETMHRNVSQQIRTLQLFEIGKVFFDVKSDTGQPREIEYLACLWTGKRSESSWHRGDDDCDFYDLKGVVEGFLGALRCGPVRFTAFPEDTCFYYRPGRTAAIYIAETLVGTLGEIHPEVLSNYHLKQTAFVLELDVDQILPLIPETKSYQPLPRYPATSRDITIIIDQEIEGQSIIEALEKSDEKILEKAELFDIYLGEKIPEDKKSVSLRLTYRSAERTLEDEDVNRIHTQLSENIINAFHAALP